MARISAAATTTALLLCLQLTSGQRACPGAQTFEKLTGVTPIGVSRAPIYASRGNAVTAECNNRALAHCHDRGICHRDIKPENCLVDPQTGVLKLTDFGCGTLFDDPKEEHTCYIGTRVFRAPELLLGGKFYGFAVDSWSAGVVLSECVIGQPIFYGTASLKEHVHQIFTHVGLPTDADFAAMKVKKIPLPKDIKRPIGLEPRFKSKNFHSRPELLALLGRIFVYHPGKRPTAWEACADEYFDVLKAGPSLPTGGPLPPLYNFTEEEIKSMPSAAKASLLGLKEEQAEQVAPTTAVSATGSTAQSSVPAPTSTTQAATSVPNARSEEVAGTDTTKPKTVGPTTATPTDAAAEMTTARTLPKIKGPKTDATSPTSDQADTIVTTTAQTENRTTVGPKVSQETAPTQQSVEEEEEAEHTDGAGEKTEKETKKNR